jgi:hypothetical protein
VSAWKKTGWLIARRILGEVAIPGLCGIAWGMLAYYQGKTLFESASTGFAAFFFIFFLQGQVLRVAKNHYGDSALNSLRILSPPQCSRGLRG